MIAFIDTNLILRFVLGDHPTLSPKAKDIISQIESKKIKAYLPEVVVAEVVYVLTKFYKYSRDDASAKILPILSIDNLKLDYKEIYPQAFKLFVSKNISFVDSYSLALMGFKGVRHIYSFDKDFDRFNWVKRLED